MAVTSLIFGIMSILSGSISLYLWSGILGIIFAVIAMVLSSKAKKRNSKLGVAKGGKVCGIIGLVLSLLGVAVFTIILLVYGSVSLLPAYAEVFG